jgi:multidrug efflux system outer membrane protein
VASIDGRSHRWPPLGHRVDVGDAADALLRVLREIEVHQVNLSFMALSTFRKLFFCVTTLLLAGCAVGPNYKRPEVNTPGNFRDATNEVSTNSLADLPWWGVFKDPTLQNLVQIALTNNYDLRITLARMDAARALQAQARSEFLPQIGYEGEANRGRNEFLGTPTPNGGRTMNSYVGGFEALWEIDLWGRVRRMNEAARANFMAAQENRRAVRISVVSTVASAYFELLELDDQLAIAKRTRDSYERTFRLFDDQHAGGLASNLELSRAKLALRSVSANIPELERRIALKENEINALLGRNPGPVPRTSTLLAHDLPLEIPIGLPSTLLERRPDVRASEQRVRAANAGIGVAVGDFFPRIGLTTFYGGTSTELHNLVSSGANMWSAAASAAGPMFTGGRLTGHYREMKAAFEEAKLEYQDTALNAFRDVSDSLISHQKFEDERVQQAEAVNAGRDAVATSTDRYKEGKASYYEVLEAQQQLFPAENALSRIEVSRRLAIVQLYKALGGGWSLKDSEWSGTLQSSFLPNGQRQ